MEEEQSKERCHQHDDGDDAAADDDADDNDTKIDNRSREQNRRPTRFGASFRNSFAKRKEGSIFHQLRHLYGSSKRLDFAISEEDDDDDDDVNEFFQQEAILPRVTDHYSLPTKSCLIRSRKHQEGVRVFEPGFSHQVVIEETMDSDKRLKVEVKTMSDVTTGHKLLNSFYAIIAGLFAGILLVFFIQLLLHIVLNLASKAGVTEMDPQLRIGNFLGTIFALVSFSHYFAEALVLAGRFIIDCYTDQPLAKTLVLNAKKRGYLVMEWFFAACFLLIPSLVGMVMMSLKNDNWWSTTSICWFILVTALFVLFSLGILYYEITAAYSIVASRPDVNAKSFVDVLKHCILLRQRKSYSGFVSTTALARNVFSNSLHSRGDDSLSFNVYKESRVVSTPIWTRLVKCMPKFLFKDLTDDPTQMYTIDDVNNHRPYLTRHNWSLERVFCLPNRSRYVAIVGGPGALTKGQLRSTVLCTALYFVLVVYLVVSILIWFNAPVSIIFIVLAILLVLNYRPLLDTYSLIQLGQDLIAVKVAKKRRKAMRMSQVKISNVPTGGNVDGDSKRIPPRQSSIQWQSDRTTEASEAVYHILTIECIREATVGLCWFCFVAELGIMFLWPAISLFFYNPSFGAFFVLASIVSNCRWYCSVVTSIQESGSMDAVGGETDEEVWENKARLNEIVTNISSNRSYKWWRSLVAILGLAFIAIFLWAFSGGVLESNAERLTYLPPNDFYYPAVSNDMRYPTCRMGSLEGSLANSSSLLDYTWLARAPYVTTDSLQQDLDTWFHQIPGVEDLQEMVDDFHAKEDPNAKIAVTLKLVSVPDPLTNKTTAIILIRGTVNQWDMLANAELWGAAALMQVLRFVIPLGEIWSPIYGELAKWSTGFASRSLERVSYYKLSTKLAEQLKQSKMFDHVHVTGHSLGGGLALITGAQAHVQAIGISAPNALISGVAFDPPVTKEELNKYTFNVVPDHDIVPRLDDIADEFQRIRCTADSNKAMTLCHVPMRAICEVMYTCGSGSRPVFCECVELFGYPEPVASKDLNYTFSEFCAAHHQG